MEIDKNLILSDDGKTLIGIKDKHITTATIPHGVTEIGVCAFYGCSALKSIDIPNSVTKIESSAFDGCSALKSIIIPHSVTEIGYSAFEGTRWLDQQPPGLIVINTILFRCTDKSVTKIEIPDNITKISHGAFEGCSALKSIDITNSVTQIGFKAFEGCSGIVFRSPKQPKLTRNNQT